MKIDGPEFSLQQHSDKTAFYMAQPVELSDTNFPVTFTCSTGELVFGQVQCVLEGLKDPHHVHQGPTHLTKEDGTVVQVQTRFRMAAKTGTWKVSRIYFSKVVITDGVETEKKHPVGFIFHHEDTSAAEYVRRASLVGMNNRNTTDDGIVYINRYDWSWQRGSRAIINAALHPVRPYTLEKIDFLLGGRVILMDASQGDAFKNILRSTLLERKSYSFVDSVAPSSSPFGVHMVLAPHTEFEFGWIGYSGQKHTQFIDSDEVVAFIYDGAYGGLECPTPEGRLYAEDELARKGGRTVPQTQEDDDDDDDYTPPSEDETDDDAPEAADEDIGTSGGSDDDNVDSEGADAGNDILEESEIASLTLPDVFPPPIISSITSIWGLGIEIHGTTLRHVKTVEVNQRPTSFEVVSNDLVQARIPPGLSSQIEIRVCNPSGWSDVFEYDHPPIPVMTRITPNTGTQWGGTLVAIRGHFLSGIRQVFFDDQPALNLEHVSDILIHVTTPPAPPHFHNVAVELDKVKQDHDIIYPTYHLCVSNPNGVRYSYNDTPTEDGYAIALTTFKKVLEARPTYFEARKQLSDVYKLTGDKLARIRLWEEGVSLLPDHGGALFQLGASYFMNEENEKAIEIWNRALEAGADDKLLFMALSEAYRRAGNTARADEIKADGERLWAPTRYD